MSFKDLLIRAKASDAAAMYELAQMYKPLITKQAIIDGAYDEDLYQELWVIFIQCVKKIKILTEDV